MPEDIINQQGLVPKYLEKMFGKSWSTTVIGLGGGAAVVLGPIITSGRLPTKNEVIQAVAIALLGLFSKAYNKTGL